MPKSKIMVDRNAWNGARWAKAPHELDTLHGADEPFVGLRAPGSPGGIMRIRRPVIVPALVALGAAGLILSGSAISPTASHAPAVHAQAASTTIGPNMYYHA